MFSKKDKPAHNELILNKHTGMLIMFSMQELRFMGTPDELKPIYHKIQLHCLTLGWWSIASFFFINPITILSNIYQWRAYKKRYRSTVLATEDPLIIH